MKFPTHPLYIPSITDPALHWRPIHRWFQSAPVQAWKDWLLDPGSLTARLQRHSHGKFKVEVTEECWWQGAAPYLTELLGPVTARQRMWSRKVVLLGNGQPWVTAHTLVPMSSLRGPLARIRKLNSRPLGAFLFSHPDLQRPVMHIVPFESGWGRCSVFTLRGTPILVAEFFLADLVLKQD